MQNLLSIPKIITFRSVTGNKYVYIDFYSISHNLHLYGKKEEPQKQQVTGRVKYSGSWWL